MPSARYAVVPRDGFFFKDGRGWYTSTSGHGHGLAWPTPPTLLGAVRTTWGRLREASTGHRFAAADWREQTADVSLGRTVALRRPVAAPAWEPAHRMWPAPRDAAYLATETRIQRLQPQEASSGPVAALGRDDRDGAARERLWWPAVDALSGAKPEPSPRFWPERDFVAWLAGQPVTRHSDVERASLTPTRRIDVQVSIGADTQTAKESALFSSDTYETLQSGADGPWQWSVGLEAELPDKAELHTIPWTLGGDRRLARAEPVGEGLFAPPSADALLCDWPGLRLVVVTPACFAAGWLPDGFAADGDIYRGRLTGIDAELVLYAAFVGRPLDVSGWDMARAGGNGRVGGPKPTRRLVAPGAVYFVRKRSGEFSADEVLRLWLAAIGSGAGEGLGRIVAGGWP